MTQPDDGFDLWSLPTFLLWMVFLGIGLAPSTVFHLARMASHVSAFRALINNPGIIIAGLALYMAGFIYVVCQRHGLSRHESQGRAIQTGVIALIACADMPFAGNVSPSLFHVFLTAGGTEFPDEGVRNAVYAAGTLKLVAWFYLLSLLSRYYIVGNRTVFEQMICVFPSARREAARRRRNRQDDRRNEADCR